MEKLSGPEQPDLRAFRSIEKYTRACSQLLFSPRSLGEGSAGTILSQAAVRGQGTHPWLAWLGDDRLPKIMAEDHGVRALRVFRIMGLKGG